MGQGPQVAILQVELSVVVGYLVLLDCCRSLQREKDALFGSVAPGGLALQDLTLLESRPVLTPELEDLGERAHRLKKYFSRFSDRKGKQFCF